MISCKGEVLFSLAQKLTCDIAKVNVVKFCKDEQWMELMHKSRSCTLLPSCIAAHEHETPHFLLCIQVLKFFTKDL